MVCLGTPLYILALVLTACALLDVLNILVRLSERDKPFGIQAEVLRTISQMVVQLDERFLVHTGVHKAVIRLLRTCVGDEIPETPIATKSLGAAGSSSRISPSEYEEDRMYSVPAVVARHLLIEPQLSIFFVFFAAVSVPIPTS